MTATTLPGATRHRTPRAGSVVLWLIVATLAALLYWAHASHVDQVVRAEGTVIASRRVQVIQAVDGGVLQALRVAEGDRVEAGQVLALFDPVRPRSEHDAADAKLAALLATMARLQAEATGSRPTYPAAVRRDPELVRVQDALFAGRRANLEADLAGMQALVDVAAQEQAITERLVAQGDAPKLDLLRVQRQLAEARAKLDSRRNQYAQDVSTEMARVRDEIEQASQLATQRRRQLENVVVEAPLAGIVKNVRFTTLGAVLKPGDELMTIVPVDDRMIVEAKVAPRDIALVRSGHEATIRFDAFDYTRYGAVDGRVTHVGADSIREEGRSDGTSPQTYYRVHVVTEWPARTRTGRDIEVMPGMTATVDVRAGDRTVLEFLLKPLLTARTEAFGER